MHVCQLGRTHIHMCAKMVTHIHNAYQVKNNARTQIHKRLLRGKGVFMEIKRSLHLLFRKKTHGLPWNLFVILKKRLLLFGMCLHTIFVFYTHGNYYNGWGKNWPVLPCHMIKTSCFSFDGLHQCPCIVRCKESMFQSVGLHTSGAATRTHSSHVSRRHDQRLRGHCPTKRIGSFYGLCRHVQGLDPRPFPRPFRPRPHPWHPSLDNLLCPHLLCWLCASPYLNSLCSIPLGSHNGILCWAAVLATQLSYWAVILLFEIRIQLQDEDFQSCRCACWFHTEEAFAGSAIHVFCSLRPCHHNDGQNSRQKPTQKQSQLSSSHVNLCMYKVSILVESLSVFSLYHFVSIFLSFPFLISNKNSVVHPKESFSIA